MSIDSIDSFLVHPAHGRDDYTQLAGIRVPMKGPLFKMLEDLFDRAKWECRIDIIFRPSQDGKQENPCRTMLMNHLHRPTPETGRVLAARLARHSSNRSGLGLLFIICGKQDGVHRLVMARFPANEGVLAEERGNRLEIEFVEKVFMKSAKSYKCVVYTTPRIDAGFWRGKAVDKQINGPQEVSEYWIGAFLESDLATTGAAGTRRLGDAIRRATHEITSDDIRAQLISAAQLIPGYRGKKVSAKGLLKTLALSDDGITAVEKAMGRKDLMDERFQLDAEEFQKAAPYQTVELDNGAILMAETRRFGDVFHTSKVAEGRTQYSTQGRVVNESLRKQK